MLGRISVQAFNFDQVFQSYIKNDFALVSPQKCLIHSIVVFMIICFIIIIKC